MNVLKSLSTSLLSFLLFLSLTIFGIAFLLSQTILNPDFISSAMDRVDVATLAEEIISEQEEGEEALPEEVEIAIFDAIAAVEPVVKDGIGDTIVPVYDYLKDKNDSLDLAQVLRENLLSSEFTTSLLNEVDIPSLAEVFINEQMEEDFPAELGDALIETITEIEPALKEELVVAADPIFDYLLGGSQSLDLKLTLRNTLLNEDFAVSLINELDISPLVSEFIGEQILEDTDIPEEMEYLVDDLDDALAEIEPTLKEELTAAADPMLDYMLGESPCLSIAISTEPMMETLEDSLRETFLESPPPEFASLSSAELEQYFDEHIGEFTETIPATIELDETLFGDELPAQIDKTITEVEDRLEQIKQDIDTALTEAEEQLEIPKEYIGYFRLGYNILIAVIVLLIIGIILLNFQIKSATRKLGIIFTTYGAVELAAILIAEHVAMPQLSNLIRDIPTYAQELIPQLTSDVLAPLQILLIVCLVLGIGMLVASFVYKPRTEQTEVPPLSTDDTP